MVTVKNQNPFRRVFGIPDGLQRYPREPASVGATEASNCESVARVERFHLRTLTRGPTCGGQVRGVGRRLLAHDTHTFSSQTLRYQRLGSTLPVGKSPFGSWFDERLHSRFGAVSDDNVQCFVRKALLCYCAQASGCSLTYLTLSARTSSLSS